MNNFNHIAGLVLYSTTLLKYNLRRPIIKNNLAKIQLHLAASDQNRPIMAGFQSQKEPPSSISSITHIASMRRRELGNFVVSADWSAAGQHFFNLFLRRRLHPLSQQTNHLRAAAANPFQPSHLLLCEPEAAFNDTDSFLLTTGSRKHSQSHTANSVIIVCWVQQRNELEHRKEADERKCWNN